MIKSNGGSALKFTLITGRTTDQGVGLESGKTSKEYHDKVAVAILNEEDMDGLKAGEGERVRVSTGSGSVVIKCKRGESGRGMVFIPLGPWASVLVGTDTGGTGMPQAKGIEAEVTKTEDEPTKLDEILKTLRGA